MTGPRRRPVSRVKAPLTRARASQAAHAMKATGKLPLTSSILPTSPGMSKLPTKQSVFTTPRRCRSDPRCLGVCRPRTGTASRQEREERGGSAHDGRRVEGEAKGGKEAEDLRDYRDRTEGGSQGFGSLADKLRNALGPRDKR